MGPPSVRSTPLLSGLAGMKWAGLSMMKAIARVVPTGVCKCRFRHSGCCPQDPYHKVSISYCVRWAGNTWRRRTQWSPILGREANPRPWSKNTPRTDCSGLEKASATSRPLPHGRGFGEGYTEVAGVRLFWPALSPMGGRSLLRRWASFESLIPPVDWLPSPTQMTRYRTRVTATAETDRSSRACCPSSCTKMQEAPTCSAISGCQWSI